MSERAAEILDAYLQAVEAGNAPTREQLLARHPDLADWLRDAFQGLDLVSGAGHDLKGGAPVDDGPGKALGDYRLIREVGRGGMAVVYEAEQVSLGRRVALKVLPFAAVLDPKQLQRFKNEALAVAGLRHPNIVPVYAVGRERGVHYYAMQLIDGQSLAQAIRDVKKGGAGEGTRTPISSHGSNRTHAYIRMAATLGVQAAEALDHAHQLGIVHRDVKPGNLLVDGGGTLFVTDFGLASSRHDTGLTMTGELLGTFRYMSPEQALAKRVPIDHRTDVYSLGATLYELFTLEAAFPGDDAHILIQEIASREPVRPRRHNPALPVDLETVLLKAMAKDPASRYATSQEMADDLKRFLVDKPVLARRPSIAERAARWSRRHRAGVAAAVVALLVGAGAMVIGAKREERNTREALTIKDEALAKAEANLKIAHTAVHDFLTQATNLTLANEPTLTPRLRHQLESALDFSDQYLSEREDAAGYGHRSSVLALLGRFEQALADADRAIEIDPNLATAHFARGAALRRLGRPEEALRAFDRSIQLDPSFPESFVERGAALTELKRPEEALKAFDRAIELQPDDPAAHNNRGQYFEARGRYEEALQCYDRSVQVAPRFALGHRNRSVALSYLGRVPEALEAIDRAIALYPDEPTSHLHRSALLANSGRPQEALVAAERAIALDPKLGRAHYNRGVVLATLGRMDEALAEYDRAVELEPDYAPAHLNRGALLHDARRFEESVAAEDRAIALAPRLANAHCVRAMALAALHRMDEAIAAYDLSTELDEAGATNPVALNAVAWRRALSQDPAFRDVKRAARLAKRATDLAPTEGAHWNTLGVVLCQAEAWQDALDAFGKSMELRNGGDAHDWFFVAIADARLGRLEEARTWYDKAVAWTDANAKDNAELKRFRADAAKAVGVQ